MIIRPDKDKVLKEFNEKYVDNKFNTEFLKIAEIYKSEKEIIKENLSLQFDFICNQGILLQENKLKGKIKYIYFSMLRTKLIENKGQWRIDLYDTNWFLDKEECGINIDFSFIYEPLFKHIKELSQEKKQYGRVIKNRDIELIKQREAKKYHGLALIIIKDLLQSFLKCNSYKNMKKEEDIAIMAGEYMDVAVNLLEK